MVDLTHRLTELDHLMMECNGLRRERDALAARLADEQGKRDDYQRRMHAAEARLARLTDAITDGGVCRLCEKRVGFGHAPACPLVTAAVLHSGQCRR